MTADALAARLASQGFEPSEAGRKRVLCRMVFDLFRARSAGAPATAWWIPGRLEVFGKHTDYCGGHSLVAPIPRGFVLLASPRPDHVVRLADALRAEEFALSAEPRPQGSEGGDSSVGSWPRYAQAVVRRLARNFPGAALGADIVFGSDLPPASGMSSSSALVVGLASALADIAGLREREEWRANVRTPVDEAGYFACFENGAPFGTLSGDAGVGTHGGSEDHVAIVCGEAGRVSAWRFVPIRHVETVTIPDSWSFVIASSGVPSEKTGPARELYNGLSARARTLLELWNRHESAESSLAAALASASSAEDRLRALAQQHGEAARLHARLDHFVREDRRVLEALDAFRRHDRSRLGELAAASQDEADTLLGNQVPETVALAESARELGASAASSFGAGFGGSVWALVDRDEAEIFAARWLADYRARFPGRTAATTFAARPGAGLARLV